MCLYKKYFELYDKHTKEMGKVAVLMQVGSFYEIYSSMDDKQGNALEIATCLNIACVDKLNKEKVATHKMAGFPDHAITKFERILLQNGYTVIYYDQDKQDPKNIVRRLTNVISPSTDLDTPKMCNWTVSVYHDQAPHPTKAKTMLHFISACAMDCTVSRDVIVMEAVSSPSDTQRANDELTHFLECFMPTECIVTSENPTASVKMVKRALGNRESETILHVNRWDPTQAIECHEALSPLSLPAWTALHEFMVYRAMSIIHPNFLPFQTNRFLELSATAYEQLDMPLLIQLLDHTKTSMGSRMLKRKLAMPMVNSEDIEASYDIIENMTEEDMVVIRSKLAGMPDMERLHQRMAMQKLNFSQLRTCWQTYDMVLKLSHQCALTVFDDQTLHTVVEELEGCFDFETTVAQRFLFKRGKMTALDKVWKRWMNTQTQLQEWKDKLETVIGKKDVLRVNTIHFAFETTKTRADVLRNKSMDKLSYDTKKVSGGTYVANPVITTLIKDTVLLEQQLMDMEKHMFQEFQKEFYRKYNVVLENVAEHIAKMDYFTTMRCVADKFRYSRPQLQNNNGPTCIQVDGLRHAIIERLQDDKMYIPNKVHLSADQHRGYVIYGMNAGGKTSTLKAVGLALVMAQAGMFVPATCMTYTPFRRIMTRIAGSDNMARGQSSFAVELEELRSVLDRADAQTLLLGDEMCRGTEVASANAIVFALLNELHKRHTFFMTATHLHDLAEPLKKMAHVWVCHTKVDIEDDDIVYHRVLEEGSGPAKYGLEVARAIGFPRDFIEAAMSFRQEQPPKVSKYNSKKVVKACEVCKYKPMSPMDMPLDTHHLNFQCDADAKGFHDHSHVHALYNLVVLCKECHTRVHQGKLELNYVQNPRGVKLQFRAV